MRKSASVVPLVALVALLAVGLACSTARSDETIANDIKAKLFADSQLKATNLEVAVSGGQVTLSGEVPNDAARYQAFRLAADTQGVKKVEDRMSVKVAEAVPPAPEPEPVPAPAPVRNTRRAAPLEPEGPPAAPPPAPATMTMIRRSGATR